MNQGDKRVLDNMGCRLHSSIYGTGKPIVLLHGLFGSHKNIGQLGRLLGKHYCVHALDLRNHGASFHKPTMSYQEMALDICDYIEIKKIAPVHLIGHSVGGKVAMQVALSFPNIVISVVALDIAPVNYKVAGATLSPNECILAGLQWLNQHTISHRAQAEVLLAPYVSDPLIRGFLLKNLKKTKEGKLALCLNIDAITKAYEHLLGAPIGEFCEKRALFIRGALSHYVSNKYRGALFEKFPNAQLSTVEKVGHWLHYEHPHDVSAIVHRFINACET